MNAVKNICRLFQIHINLCIRQRFFQIQVHAHTGPTQSPSGRTCPPMAIVSPASQLFQDFTHPLPSFFGALVCHYHVDLMRHVDAIRNGLIHNKMNLGCIAQIDFLCKTSADKTLCAL